MLKPLYEKLIEKVNRSDYLMDDETPIPVLIKDKPGATYKGFFWVYRSHSISWYTLIIEKEGDVMAHARRK